MNMHKNSESEGEKLGRVHLMGDDLLPVCGGPSEDGYTTMAPHLDGVTCAACWVWTFLLEASAAGTLTWRQYQEAMRLAFISGIQEHMNQRAAEVMKLLPREVGVLAQSAHDVHVETVDGRLVLVRDEERDPFIIGIRRGLTTRRERRRQNRTQR